jgi:succinoglycan biosynthesis protein ExoO
MHLEVSVIIPAYNTESYIAQAIESALNQTQKNIEVIVVDDASRDATAEVAKSFTDTRLKVLVNQQNLGAVGARNHALREAKGKWIAVLDSDDWYAPERLENLLQVAYAEKADLIADDLYLVQDGEKCPFGTWLGWSGEQIDQIRHIDLIYFVETDRYGQRGLHLGISKPLIKRDFLIQHGIEYDESLRMGQDFWFYINCLVHGSRFVLVPKPYYFYRSRKGSLVTQSQLERLNQYYRATVHFLEQESVQKNFELVRVLSENLTIFEKNRAYYRVVEPLKKRAWLAAFTEIIRNPCWVVDFIRKIPSILTRRISYYILKNQSAYAPWK